MDQQTIFLTILGMMAVTYVPRALPLLALAQRTLPEAVIRWLGFIPVAVLSAMLLPSLVATDRGLDFSAENIFLWAAIPTFVVCWKTRSFIGAIVTGMACVALGRLFLA
ncbi:MAG: AzlD domain-containing protein [Desulfomicrobium sp.]|nr:AzlD domain-containing protein [Desulfomicrobium sp.]MDP3429559.1 AzlD domain-containing protein [Desulfomicrobium sp.]